MLQTLCLVQRDQTLGYKSAVVCPAMQAAARVEGKCCQVPGYESILSCLAVQAAAQRLEAEKRAWHEAAETRQVVLDKERSIRHREAELEDATAKLQVMHVP